MKVGSVGKNSICSNIPTFQHPIAPSLDHSGVSLVTLARNAMATRFEIALHGDNPITLRAAGEEALDEIERLESQLSLYRPGSEISHINRRAACEAVRVEPRLFKLLQRAQTISRQTNGAFDITAGPLIRCWGFMAGSGG